MLKFLSLILLICLSGCASVSKHGSKPDRRADSDFDSDQVAGNIVWGVFLGPVAIALAPIWLPAWAIAGVKQAASERVFIPAGLTKEAVEKQIAMTSGSAMSSTRLRGGDEFLRVAKGDKIYYARFRGNRTVDYGKK